MKNRIPRRQELLVFLALSVASTVIVRIAGKPDVGLAFCGAPLFLVASLMGLRRHGEGNAREAAPAAETGKASVDDASA